MLGRRLAAAAPTFDDRTPGCHEGDALGPVFPFMGHIPKVVLEECSLGKPEASFHDGLKAGVVGPG